MAETQLDRIEQKSCTVPLERIEGKIDIAIEESRLMRKLMTGDGNTHKGMIVKVDRLEQRSKRIDDRSRRIDYIQRGVIAAIIVQIVSGIAFIVFKGI